MTCRVCLEDKPEAEFHVKNSATGLRHKKCKQCSRAYSAQHYRANADVYKQRGVINAVRRRDELHRKLYAYLTEHPCVDCGEPDPVVLDFDHRDGVEKLLNVSRMWYNGYAWDKILQEIEKCDVRCANCHRRRTARQKGWSNLNY